jgi:hypothetical protein
MNDLVILIPIVTVLSGVLLWLFFPRHKSPRPAAVPIHHDMDAALPAPRHYRYFRQIWQALSVADSEYLIQNAPPQVAKRALRERRAVARGFLKGLREDFSNLARLARIIAALSPEVSHKQETERLILTLKFQLLYALVWLRLSAGNLPLQQLDHLTGLVGRLTARMDEAMAEIAAQSAGQQLPGRLRA